MAKRIDVSDLNVYYGSTHAVKDVNMTIDPCSVTAFIGPSGCGKTTFLRTLNRMHEVIPGAHVKGKVLLDGDNIYGSGVDPVRVRTEVGMVFQRPNPFPTMSIQDNVLAGFKLNGKRLSLSDREEIVEKSLRGANLWNEVKDRLDKPGSGLSGGQQPSVHRPHYRSPAVRDPDGRAVLRARPDLHARRRGPHQRAQGHLHRGDRDSQHAAGSPRL